MLPTRISLVLPAALLVAACQSTPNHHATYAPNAEQMANLDRWMVNDIHDTAINNALITGHTVYPYHFATGAATLNELGERDLTALAAYYRTTPGALNVRRGDATEDLYKARVECVSKRLADLGVDMTRLKIADAPAGGPGMASEQVVKILQSQDKPFPADAGSATAGTGTSGTGGSGESTPSAQNLMPEVTK